MNGFRGSPVGALERKKIAFLSVSAKQFSTPKITDAECIFSSPISIDWRISSDDPNWVAKVTTVIAADKPRSVQMKPPSLEILVLESVSRDWIERSRLHLEVWRLNFVCPTPQILVLWAARHDSIGCCNSCVLHREFLRRTPLQLIESDEEKIAQDRCWILQGEKFWALNTIDFSSPKASKWREILCPHMQRWRKSIVFKV